MATKVSTVRYEGSGPRERGFLLRALVDVWDNKCYWCNTSGDQSEFEIDHLVPPEKATEGITAYGLDADFDVQAPENLAPICAAGSRCNQRKSDRVFEEIGNGLVASALVKTRSLAPSVEQKVQSLRTGRGLSKALDKVLGSDLTPKTRTLIGEQGRALIQRVRAVDPLLVEDAPVPYRHFPAADVYIGELPGCGPEDLGEVVVELDGSGRRARAVLEDVCDVELGDLVDELMRSLFALVDETVHEEGPSGDFWQPFDLVGLRGLSLTGLRAVRDGDRIEVEIRGRCWSHHSASVFGLDAGGRLGAEGVGSCEISVEGEFSATASLPLDDDWDHELEIDASALAFERFDDYDRDA